MIEVKKEGEDKLNNPLLDKENKERNALMQLLTKMNEKLEKLEVETERLNKENARLRFAADKGRTYLYDMRHKEEQEAQVDLRMFRGKLVVKWAMMRNLVEKIDGVWVEDQKIKVDFIDGSSLGDIDLVDFERNFLKIPAIIKEMTQAKDGTWFNVETINGDKVKIHSKFVN